MTTVQIDDRDSSIQYTGDWGQSGNPATEYLGTTTFAGSAGPQMKLSFTGTWISVYGTVPGQGTNVSFVLDDGSQSGWSTQFFSTGVQDILYQQPYYNSPPLPYGTHSIVMTNGGGGTTAFVDFIRYNTSSPNNSTPPSVVTVTATATATMTASSGSQHHMNHHHTDGALTAAVVVAVVVPLLVLAVALWLVMRARHRPIASSPEAPMLPDDYPFNGHSASASPLSRTEASFAGGHPSIALYPSSTGVYDGAQYETYHSRSSVIRVAHGSYPAALGEVQPDDRGDTLTISESPPDYRTITPEPEPVSGNSHQRSEKAR